MARMTSPHASECGSNPSAAMTRLVLKEMGDTWQHEPEFFKKFFPIHKSLKTASAKIKSTSYNYKLKRWKGIPACPKSVSILSTSLLNLFNGMLSECDLDRHRRFFKTKPTRVATGRTTFTTPNILLAGSGPEFMNTGIDLPFAQYAQGIAPFEVRLQSPLSTNGHGRLAVHIHEMFSDQDNRRFAVGVVTTQQTITVCIFDHSGCMFSDPLDYHANPQQFCAVLIGLASTNSSHLGFDHTMYRSGRAAKIRTTELNVNAATRGRVRSNPTSQVYTIKETLFHFHTVVGKGTICWLVRDDSGDGDYVIKDAWIASEDLPGRESEHSLLVHIRGKGVCQGVVQIRHAEEVPADNRSTIDNILNNRKSMLPENSSIQRIHNRLVFLTYGKPLDQFSTPKEFLFAYHDALLAHRNVHDVAGVLHRDISIRNILINPGGGDGNRGILIDFDHALRLDDTSPYSTKRRIGTWPYMSRNVLQDGSHTHFDDLESFYYVFLFITIGFSRPGTPVMPHPDILEAWEGKFSWAVKYGFISQPFDQPTRYWDATKARAEGRTPPSSSPSVDYNEFLSHVREAIAQLDSHNCNSTSEKGKSSVTLATTGKEGTDEHTSTLSLSTSRRQRTTRIPPTLRPRRSTAKYK